MSERAVAILIRDDAVLLMRRIKDGEEYYTFPGGMIEQGESPDVTAVRELAEETTVTSTVTSKLCELDNLGRHEYYFMVRYVSGEPELSGEEKDRMTEANQYYPGWYPLDTAFSLPNLYPHKVVELLKQHLGT